MNIFPYFFIFLFPFKKELFEKNYALKTTKKNQSMQCVNCFALKVSDQFLLPTMSVDISKVFLFV